jgi:negative regulator of sigma E activity
MKKHLAKITKRSVAAMLVTAAVVGVSALAMQASTPNQNSLAPSLKSIQTDKATSFYVGREPSRSWFVECVLPGTSESKAATSNLKVIATTL